MVYPLINAHDRMAFTARLKGPTITADNDTGIWVQNQEGILELVAREGTSRDEGLVLNHFGTFETGQPQFSLNALGQVAFMSGKGLWATSLDGDLQLIEQVGQTIDLDNGPGTILCTIHELNFSSGRGNQDGRSSGLSDRGELDFSARVGHFFDGAVLVSTAVMIPEPPIITLCLLRMLCTAFVRKH